MAKYDVNIDLANEAKKEMASLLNNKNSRMLNKVGAFASLYDFNFKDYEEPVLVLKTEEPGSKQLLAVEYDRIEGVCYDMINHLINDCIVMGATPLTIQDAIICGKLDKDIVTRIVSAISEACLQNDCVLTGGETSEQPGVLDNHTYILTSSIVGVVDKKYIIDGSEIQEGDVVLGLASSGIHTNGYTLVRKIINEHPDILNEQVANGNFIDAVLTPHRCYYSALKGLFHRNLIHGLAHITGGGICENLNRILPCELDAQIDLSSYRVLDIFKTLQTYGKISDKEMLRTFNMGIGMVLVCKEHDASIIMEHLKKYDVESYRIGKINKGTGNVVCVNNFKM